MPAAVMAAMSAVWLTTTLWPITCAAILPVCTSSMVIFGQDADTVAVFRSYCIASLPLSFTTQLGAACA